MAQLVVSWFIYDGAMMVRSACMPSTRGAAAKAVSSKSKWSIQARDDRPSKADA
jgi:hypothetical protein